MNKRASGGGCGNFPAENGLVGEVLPAVVGGGVVAILINDVAGEVNTCEDAFVA